MSHRTKNPVTRRRQNRSPLEGDSRAAIKARVQAAEAKARHPFVKLTGLRSLVRSVARAAGVPSSRLSTVMKALRAARVKAARVYLDPETGEFREFTKGDLR